MFRKQSKTRHHMNALDFLNFTGKKCKIDVIGEAQMIKSGLKQNSYHVTASLSNNSPIQKILLGKERKLYYLLWGLKYSNFPSNCITEI